MRIVPWVVVLFLVTAAQGGVCDRRDYRITGVVHDSSGRPVPDVRVYLLLDRISEKKFAEQGLRARVTRTNVAGRYQQRIVCPGKDRARGEPNPCAGNPKSLTVAVESRDRRLKLNVYKLRDLDVADLGEGCAVRVPEIRISSAY